MRLSELTPYENNPRKNENAVTAVAESIKQFGFKVPLVIDADGVIVAGHTRYKAAQMLKLDTVPCLIADDLTDDQVRAFRIADNKAAELAEWDFEKLDLEMSALPEINFTALGFAPVEGERQNNEWFDRKEKDGNAHEEGNDEYNSYVDKF